MIDYVLMHKSRYIASFGLNEESGEVEAFYIMEKECQHLPLPLKRILRFPKAYVENGHMTIKRCLYKVNEDGMELLWLWLRDRAIPYSRENRYKYIRKDCDSIAYMLDNYAYSLTDCYWIRRLRDRHINYEKLRKKFSSKFDAISIVNTNSKQYSSVNCTLGGVLEKFWFIDEKDKRLSIAKLANNNSSILIIREVIASKIYEKQMYSNFCKYSYIRNKERSIVGCKCKAFTNEHNELITAYDLLEEFNETQFENTIENIIKRAVAYGANKAQLELQLDIQTLVDYLITNRDRHLNNIGFLRNPDTLRIKCIAPIFDSGSSFHMEGERPESVLNTTINGMYNTELECLKHVRNLNTLNLSMLPDNRWIKAELEKADTLSRYRLDNLFNLYKQKKEYLKQLQKGQQAL